MVPDNNYKRLFHMLVVGRFDYCRRFVTEVSQELALNGIWH